MKANINPNNKGKIMEKPAKRYTVSRNKFHGDQVVYEGNSLIQAVKSARKIDCDECKCGGPSIRDNETGEYYMGWNACKPFRNKGQEAFWASN